MELARYGRIIDGNLFVEVDSIISAFDKSNKALSCMMTDCFNEGYYTALVVLGNIASEIEKEIKADDAASNDTGDRQS